MDYSNEGDRLQTTDSLAGFFSKASVSDKTMEKIMKQDPNLKKYDGFRVSGVSRVLNQIGLNQRRHNIQYKVSSGEFAIPMELTGNVMDMQLIPRTQSYGYVKYRIFTPSSVSSFAIRLVFYYEMDSYRNY